MRLYRTMAVPPPRLHVDLQASNRLRGRLEGAFGRAGIGFREPGADAEPDVVIVTSVDVPARRNRDPRLLALVADTSPNAVEALLRVGVRGVLDVDSDPVAVAGAVVAVARGYAVLPAHGAALARVLAAVADLTDEERRWMDRLADGDGVPALAAAAGMREPLLYQRLADVYRRFGVDSRREAIAAHLAQQRRVQMLGS